MMLCVDQLPSAKEEETNTKIHNKCFILSAIYNRIR